MDDITMELSFVVIDYIYKKKIQYYIENKYNKNIITNHEINRI